MSCGQFRALTRSGFLAMWTDWFRDTLFPDCGLIPRSELPPSTDRPIPATIEAVLPADGSGFPISRALARALAQLVLGGAVNVLELGAGTSSLVLAKSLALTGGRLTSVDQNPAWCEAQWAVVRETGVDAHLELAQLSFGLDPFPCHRYTAAQKVVQSRGPFDLVLVDAPQAYYGRDGALPLIAGSLVRGALIVLDDARRPRERWAVHRWLQSYTGLDLVVFDPLFGRNGVAILRSNGATHSRRSTRAWTSATFHAGVNGILRIVRNS